MRHTQDPANLRAELARHQIRIYVVAPAVGMHPRQLGRMLSGREPMREAVAIRLARAIDRAVSTEARASAQRTAR